jgi:hypothetical protein
MTTNHHGDQARDLSDTLSDLHHTLWALQGLGEVMYPDHHLEGGGRSNIAMLIGILTERFEHLLEEAEERWHSTPAQEQEGDDAD